MKLKDIDFRVWDISKKVFYNDLGFSILPSSSCSKTFRMDLAITFAKNLESACMLSSNYEVDFYTGFRDRNGKKIYEGDIVCFSGEFRKVVFEKGAFALKLQKERYGFIFFYLLQKEYGTDATKLENIEVIGNIHENPELLQEDIE